jgi:type VI secretion system protein ImpM
MDPQAAQDQHITFEQLDWVEEQADSDYAVKKLSTYLSQPTLSLKSALESVSTAFIGT